MFSNWMRVGSVRGLVPGAVLGTVLGAGLAMLVFVQLGQDTLAQPVDDDPATRPLPARFAQSNPPAHHWLAHPDHIGATELRDIGAHPLRYDGTLVGDPTLAEVPDGWALDLNGIDQSVQMGQVQSGEGLPAEAMTVEAWVSVHRSMEAEVGDGTREPEA